MRKSPSRSPGYHDAQDTACPAEHGTLPFRVRVSTMGNFDASAGIDRWPEANRVCCERSPAGTAHRSRAGLGRGCRRPRNRHSAWSRPGSVSIMTLQFIPRCSCNPASVPDVVPAVDKSEVRIGLPATTAPDRARQGCWWALSLDHRTAQGRLGGRAYALGEAGSVSQPGNQAHWPGTPLVNNYRGPTVAPHNAYRADPGELKRLVCNRLPLRRGMAATGASYRRSVVCNLAEVRHGHRTACSTRRNWTTRSNRGA